MRRAVKPPIGKPRGGSGGKGSRPRSTKANKAIASVTPSMYIDDRAGSRNLVKYPPLDKCGELCRLSSGDVAIQGHGPNGPVVVGVEVKSIFDLINSMDTGRLQGTQIPMMLSEYDECYLLYYGLYRPSPSNGALEVYRGGGWREHAVGTRGVPYGYVAQFLMTLRAAGVSVVRTGDEREAAAWLGALARWWSKPWNSHKSLRAFDHSHRIVSGPVGDGNGLLPKFDDATLRKARVAKEIPGLGFERALAAAKHFETVEDMVKAGWKEWAEVPGIGKTIAQSIVRSVWWKRQSV